MKFIEKIPFDHKALEENRLKYYEILVDKTHSFINQNDILKAYSSYLELNSMPPVNGFDTTVLLDSLGDPI